MGCGNFPPKAKDLSKPPFVLDAYDGEAHFHLAYVATLLGGYMHVVLHGAMISNVRTYYRINSCENAGSSSKARLPET